MTKIKSRGKRIFAMSVLAMAIPIVQGCQPKDVQHAAAPQAMPVTVDSVKPVVVPIAHEVVAYAEASKTVEVRARVGGILEDQVYADGAHVKAGQVLYKIDRVPLQLAVDQLRADAMEAVAKSKQAIREENRMQSLFAGKSVSRKDYDDAISTREMAQAAQASAKSALKKAELDLSYANVTAPVDGIASRAEKSIGSLITTGTDSLLTSIVQLDPVWVNFSLTQKELASMGLEKVGAKGITSVDAVLEDGSKYPVQGHINFIDSKINSEMSTIQMRAEFPNPEGKLLPGQFMKLKLNAGSFNDAFLIPQSAVLQSDAGRFVYTVGAENTVKVTPIKAGPWQGKDWVILGGLETGDKVVIDNLIKLRPGVPVTAVEQKAQ
jgi:membrane fusion protein (multidrug efflux system)